MGGRYLLFLLEDIATFELEEGDEGRTHLDSYCSLTTLFLNCFLRCYGFSTNDHTFYSIVSPNFSLLGKWISVNDKSAIETIQNQIQLRIEKNEPNFHQSEQELNTTNTDIAISKKKHPSIRYRTIYDSVLQLKSELSPSDVLDVIWILPNIEGSHTHQMAMEVDTTKAPFLYRSLICLQEFSTFVQITLVTAYSSNSVAIWSKLLNASVYYIPSLSVPHVPPSNDVTLANATSNSLIIETAKEAPSLPPSEKTSRLPIIHNPNLYTVTPNEMEMVFCRLMAMNIEGRCRFEWREVNHAFHPSLQERDEFVGSIQSATASVIQTKKSSTLEFSAELSIQLLNQYSSLEMIQLLHNFLQSSIEYSIILAHPTKNPLKSLYSEQYAYYGCCITSRSSNKSFSLHSTSIASYKTSCQSFYGIAMFSSTSSFLYLMPSEDYGPLQFILCQAIHHPSTQIILDSDMDSTLLHTRVINEDKEEEQPLFVIPSDQPPISHDLCQFSTRINQDPTDPNRSHSWLDEEVLKHISNLTVRDSDLWRQRLFGEDGVKQQTKKKPKKRKLIPSLQPCTSSRIPQSVFDITRCFVNTGEPAVDVEFFEFQPLPLPSQIPSPLPYHSSSEAVESFKQVSIEEASASLFYSCCCEDYWREDNPMEEFKIRGMSQRVDGYGTLVLSSSQKNKRVKKVKSNIDVNLDRLERAVHTTILHVLPSSYHETPLYEKVWSLSTALCRTVIDTLYDIQQVLLPSSLLVKEARKHVYHVVTSLLPNEPLDKPLLSKRSSRLSDISSFLDASPYSRSEVGQTPSSLLGTPSSLGVAMGMESKRPRCMPQPPSAPISHDPVFFE